ncbi:phosphosulfolactate phosphohydrolase-like enzyme [Okibacterium sp. HSC-33S16]|uniref:2-phosphosulfolactate phosphatase n=1 Tax=Okibacterium sp. HSC-33S16 TaxID=2910965 RepID=UPI0020A0D45A|nr:2-phosphosulfolactate phosphatase [Okibacterium sp. HSC-33S16]MCP2029948.1 phosphosulfolactate phosphohydrolase-like enzyme [Okibacterium sp. HSC-33S16]
MPELQRETTATAQSKYQVRFDVGLDGLTRVGAADIVVWVDALGVSDTDAVLDALDSGATAVRAGLVNRRAVAQWVLDQQVGRGRRVSIAIVAAGRGGGFSSTDVLAAGAVIDALVALGIDFTSPEAAVACAAYESLRNAVGHLFTASVSGQELLARGERDRVVAAAQVDSSTDVTVLRLV